MCLPSRGFFGVFHVAPEADTKPLEELFRARVLKMLRKAGKIDAGRIRMLLGGGIGKKVEDRLVIRFEASFPAARLAGGH